MKKLILCVAIGIATLTSCKKDMGSITTSVQNQSTADGVLETALPTHRAIATPIGTDVKNGYWETLPSLYPQTTKKYPLIIFIHGIGELSSSGKTLGSINCCGLPYYVKGGQFPPKFLVNGQYYSYIVVSPQFVNRPTAAQVQEVINYAKAKYRVDPNRIYVDGMSMGGGSDLDWAQIYGIQAAAIVPICPGTAPTTTKAQAIAKQNLAIWWIYGSADVLVPASQGTTWHNLVDQYNPTYAAFTKLTIFSGLSHNSTWAKGFNPGFKENNMNIYEWQLQYQRGVGVPIARAGLDRTIPLDWNYFPMLNGTASTDPDGWIAAFNWTQVSGPNTASLSAPNSGQCRANGLIRGTYIFRLKVTDNKGNIATDDIKITMT